MRYITTKNWKIPPQLEMLFTQPRSLVMIGGLGTPIRDISLHLARELAKKYNVFYFSFKNREKPFKESGKKSRKRKIAMSQLDMFILKHSPDDIQPLYEYSSKLPRKSVVFIDDFDDLVLSYQMKGDAVEPEEILYLIQKDIVEGSGISVMLLTSYSRDSIYKIADAIMELTDRKFNSFAIKVVKIIFTNVYEYLLSLNGGYTYHSPGKLKNSRAKRVEVLKDRKGYISTGIQDLDLLLEGGLRPGSYNVFEISKDVLNEAFRPIIYMMAITNLKKRRGVAIAPAESSSYEDYFSEIREFIDESEVKYLKILRSTPVDTFKPWYVDGYSQYVDGRFEVWKMVMEHLMKISDGGVMDITEYGAIEATFTKNEVIRLVSQGVKWMSQWGGVGIGIISEESEVKNKLMYLSHRYLKIRSMGSIYCIEGIKPLIHPRIIDIGEKKGKIDIKLRRIV